MEKLDDQYINRADILNMVTNNKYESQIEQMCADFRCGNITLSEDEIKEYLFSRAEADGIDMVQNLDDTPGDSIRVRTEKWLLAMKRAKYIYANELDYYQKYVDILRKKGIKLIKILLNIADTCKDNFVRLEMLSYFDINMHQDQIKLSDAKRIVDALIKTYEAFIDSIEKGNNKETYLLTPSYEYPDEELRQKSIYDECEDDTSVELSCNQCEKRICKMNETGKQIVKLMDK